MLTRGIVIRRLLLRRGWNQRLLCERTGLSKNTISKLLRDGGNVNPKTLDAVLAALEIRSDQFERICRGSETIEEVLDADGRRVRVALATIMFDVTVPGDTLKRIERWAMDEGRRIEQEDDRGSIPEYRGMLVGLLGAIDPKLVDVYRNGRNGVRKPNNGSQP